MSGAEVLATLPDGSVAIRQRIDHRTSIIGREVDGACVWGQAFSADGHEQQVADLVARMVANPGAFVRWWDVKVKAGSMTATAAIIKQADRETAAANDALAALTRYYTKGDAA